MIGDIMADRHPEDYNNVCKGHSGLIERIRILESGNEEIKDSVDTIKGRLTGFLVSVIIGIVLLIANLVSIG